MRYLSRITAEVSKYIKAVRTQLALLLLGPHKVLLVTFGIYPQVQVLMYLSPTASFHLQVPSPNSITISTNIPPAVFRTLYLVPFLHFHLHSNTSAMIDTILLTDLTDHIFFQFTLVTTSSILTFIFTACWVLFVSQNHVLKLQWGSSRCIASRLCGSGRAGTERRSGRVYFRW